ncbi:MAG TPA: DUF1501 domain-containing protein [Terriglobia bacterium]|jgi:uncharacterized protein (DUF1501 family)|nr:DUF1501 domain-containing protein [Terriglobia bacterium]
MAITRRYFLKSGGLSLFGASLVPSFLRRTAYALDQPRASARKKILVAVFQRGAADGLNIVVPFGDKSYSPLRPSIAIPEPGSRAASAQGAIDLDGFFGLHPSLGALKPLYDARQLAIVHAAGSPDSTRSHFDAQDYMETATPGRNATPDGWLSRYLEGAPEAETTPFRAVAFAARMPRTLVGAAPALVLDDVKGFRLRAAGGGSPSVLRDGFEALYASASDPLLDRTAQEMFEAAATLEQVGAGDYQPAGGVEYPKGPLGKSLRQVAQLIKSDVGLEVAFAEAGGWDHHVNEGGVQGQLANNLKQFGDALAAFHQDLGERMSDVVLLTMTEFGRTAHENGNRGTDHGHASAMFVLGGPVKGGKVYGQWPGLAPGQLYEGRDLALTTDFRDVFAEVAVRHLGAAGSGAIFPGFNVSPSRFRGFLG